MEPVSKEKRIFQISSVLLLIDGGLMLALSVSNIFMGNQFNAQNAPNADAFRELFLIYSYIDLLSAAFGAFCGLMGLRDWNRPKKGRACFVLGIFLLAVELFSVTVELTVGSFTASSLLSLVLPMLFTIGAGLKVRSKE